MKIQWKKLIVCLAVPLAVGGLSALLTRGSMETFEAIAKPPLAPPCWVSSTGAPSWCCMF